MKVLSITDDQAKILLMHTQSTIRLVSSIMFHNNDLKAIVDFDNMIREIERQLIMQGTTLN